MSINRFRRDAAADILAAYLRGELDREEARDKLIDLARMQKGIRDHVIDKASWYLDDVFLPVDEAKWRHFRRQMVFLKTDLEWDAPQPYELSPDLESARWEWRQAVGHLIALLLAAVVAYWLSWWILVAAIPLSALIAEATRRSHEFAWEERLRLWEESEPFANGADWLAHQHLADEENLPPYAESPFPPPPSPPGSPLVAALKRWTVRIATAAFFSVLAVGYALAWPLLLLVNACLRPK